MKDFEIVVQQTPGVIQCDFTELKEELEIQMNAYSEMEISEDRQKEAKADLATLRKIRKAFDDRRKQVKEEYMIPYNAFEGEAKQILAIIDKPISLIDGKLKDFDADRIAKKQEHLRDLYAQNINGLEDFLPFETVKKTQWDNKSYTDQDIIYDISEATTKVETDLSAIRALHSEIEAECIETYKRTGNLAAAIQKNSDFLSTKKAVEERIRQEQERKAKEAESQPEIAKTDVLDANFAEKSQNSDLKTPKDDFINQPEPGFWIGVFSETALEDIRAYCEFNEIPYKKEVR